MSEKLSDKERFFSKVSHDLRGSFTGILGFSDILNDPNEKLSNDEILEYTSRIAKQSHESFELLVNFINWLKMEDYDYGLTYEKLDLVEAIHEIYQYHKKEFSKKNVRLSLDSGDSVYVNMDHEILSSILKNVFSFLLKLCCSNSILDVGLGKTDENNVTVKINSECAQDEAEFLQNINLRELNSDLSFPIIFAIKFTELSGGQFQFAYDQNRMHIDIKLPSN